MVMLRVSKVIRLIQRESSGAGGKVTSNESKLAIKPQALDANTSLGEYEKTKVSISAVLSPVNLLDKVKEVVLASTCSGI